jgi:hypothetical protein
MQSAVQAPGINMDLDGRAKEVMDELDRARCCTSKFMDTAVLLGLEQRYVTSILIPELERELDKVLLIQVFERENLDRALVQQRIMAQEEAKQTAQAEQRARAIKEKEMLMKTVCTAYDRVGGYSSWRVSTCVCPKWGYRWHGLLYSPYSLHATTARCRLLNRARSCCCLADDACPRGASSASHRACQGDGEGPVSGCCTAGQQVTVPRQREWQVPTRAGSGGRPGDRRLALPRVRHSGVRVEAARQRRPSECTCAMQ